MVDTKYKHVIITFFNWARPNWGVSITDEYMDYRFKIFEKVCYPSVLGQDADPSSFLWLITFDPNSEDKYFERAVKFARANDPQVIISFSQDYYTTVIAKYILKPEDEVLVTTSLDNDDALTRYHIRYLQKQFASFDGVRKRVNPMLISFRYGYKFDLFGRKAYKYGLPNNAFPTMLENVFPGCSGKDLKTAYESNHSYLIDKYPTIFVELPQRGWLQGIHAKNICNQISSADFSNEVSLDIIDEEFATDWRELK
jgi:hypothetical protein